MILYNVQCKLICLGLKLGHAIPPPKPPRQQSHNPSTPVGGRGGKQSRLLQAHLEKGGGGNIFP